MCNLGHPTDQLCCDFGGVTSLSLGRWHSAVIPHLSNLNVVFSARGGGSVPKWCSMPEQISVWNGGSEIYKLCGSVYTQNGGNIT